MILEAGIAPRSLSSRKALTREPAMTLRNDGHCEEQSDEAIAVAGASIGVKLCQLLFLRSRSTNWISLIVSS
jgi:hypothetical protein